MSFFEDLTVQEVIQKNIEKVEELEEKEQKRILKVFRKVRLELLDRLLTIQPGTFTAEKLQLVLAQVQSAILAIKRDLKFSMSESSEKLAVKGTEDLLKEVTKLSKHFEGSIQPLPLDTILLASQAQTFLLNKHEASLDAYGEGLRAQITSHITQSMVLRDSTRQTVSAITADVGRFFQGEEWRLNRIVRTELHNIYNFAKLNTLKETKDNFIPDLKKSLMHPIDSRTGNDSKALADLNPIVDIDEPFSFTWKGQKREFLFPPDRPNDRAILVPYREEWGEQAAEFKTKRS